MQVSGWIIAALIACLPITAFAAEGIPAEGKAKAEAAGCNGCHGPEGVANQDGLAIDKNMPNLAGEPDLYLQFQLVYFRKGVRKNDYMNPVAESLSDEDIRNLGAYFASLPAPRAPPPADAAPEDTSLGAKVAQGLHCSNCHGDHFEGVRKIWAASRGSAKTISTRRCATSRAAPASRPAPPAWPRSSIRSAIWR